MDRLGNVLDLDLAQVLEGDIVPAPDLTEDGAGDADAAGIRQALHARGDINPVAVDVAALGEDIAQVHADAKLEGRRARLAFRFGERSLDLHRAAHGLDRAAELGQQAVTHELDDVPLVSRDRRLDQLLAKPPDAVERAGFVFAHEPAVADHIGGQDGCEPAVHAGIFHAGASNRSNRVRQCSFVSALSSVLFRQCSIETTLPGGGYLSRARDAKKGTPGRQARPMASGFR